MVETTTKNVEINYSDIIEAKWQLESQLKKINQTLEQYLLVECSACYQPCIGHMGLPTGWGWHKAFKRLFCDKCVNKLLDNGIQRSNIYKEGDEL